MHPYRLDNIVDQEFSYYENLPKARGLCDREMGQLCSLYPLKPLHPALSEADPIRPETSFTKKLSSESRAPVSSAMTDSTRIFMAPSTKFNEVFNDPLYKCHPNLVCTDNNSTFAQLRFKNREIREPKNYPVLQEQALDQQSSTSLPEPIKEFDTDSHNRNCELKFESRFQCGNLALAQKCGHREYNLAIRKDINTNGCTQWFYFSVNNYKKTGPIRFNILNFTKPYSAFQNGMQPVVFSSCKHAKKGISWHRSCQDIQYSKNNITRSDNRSYYTLSFTYLFEEPNDEVYIAYCYPYSYSRLQVFLKEMEDKNSKILHRRRFSSLAGNYIQVLTITNHTIPSSRKRGTIFLTARVHPGETVSSFICEGLIRFLVGDSREASNLRDQTIFKIIPILNPDGVINGNYRCSLSGRDLNRIWNSCEPALHPEIFSAKKMISDCQGTRLCYIDLHGHSKKRAMFTYGCRSRTSPFQCRELPFLLHKKMSHFNYYYCNFTVPRVRDGTARICVWREFNINLSYTLECSFFGPLKEQRNYTLADLQEAGKQLGAVISLYFCRKRLREQGGSQAQGVFHQSKDQDDEIEDIFEQLYNNNELLNIGDDVSEGSSSAQSLEEAGFSTVTSMQISTPVSSPTSRWRDSPTRVRPQTMRAVPMKKEQPNKSVNLQFPSQKKEERIRKRSFKRNFEQDRARASFRNSSPQKSQNMESHMGLVSRVPPILDIVQEITRGRHSREEPSSPTQKRASSNCLQRSFQMSSIVFPSNLRGEYTNYQRYRREEFDITQLIFGQRRAVKEVYIGRKLSNLGERSPKREIKSVERRELNLQARIRKAI